MYMLVVYGMLGSVRNPHTRSVRIMNIMENCPYIQP